jgi:hypothetical protein
MKRKRKFPWEPFLLIIAAAIFFAGMMQASKADVQCLDQFTRIYKLAKLYYDRIELVEGWPDGTREWLPVAVAPPARMVGR